jgi:hypothetical protein
MVLLALSLLLPGIQTAVADAPEEEIAALNAQRQNAIARVEAIVNQPVTPLPRTPEMVDVGFYSPGWFHEGALKPDFNRVDVRVSQQSIYDDHQFATSDSNPGVVFLGKEIAFNAMTKYFYTNRALPKKKLSEAEMMDINQEYRTIGYCEQRLKELNADALLVKKPPVEAPKPESATTRMLRRLSAHRTLILGVAELVALYVVIRMIARKRGARTWW